MTHPFLKNNLSIAIYGGVWLLAGLLHFSWFYFQIHLPFEHSLFDAIIFNLVFALLGLAIWPLTFYNRPDKTDPWSVFMTQLISAAILVTVWILTITFVTNKVADLYPAKILHVSATTERIGVGLMYYMLLFLVSYFIIIFRENKEKKLNEEKLKRIIRESELNILKAQINPHFLFNSLNSVNYLIASDPDRASEMLAQLSDYLRYSLRKGDEGLVSFKDEMKNCERFLAIEKLRFGDKMILDESIEKACMDVNVPLMILQPLYENAIKHGVYESLAPILISTNARIKNSRMEIIISNTFDPDSLPRKGAGVGLRNVSDRLSLTFGQKGLLRTAKEDNRFTAVVTIPL